MSWHWRSDLSRFAGVTASRFRREARDARGWQILSLAGLLAWNLDQLDLGASFVPSCIAISATVATQLVFARLWALPSVDLRSPLITGLSLALLLRGDALWVPAAAGVLSIAAKFVLRIDGKHLFNPAAFGTAAMLASGHAWVTPGQWGQSAILAASFVCLATLVLTRASRLDLALAFLAAHGGLLLARAAWLGDPIAIPVHQIENGALLLFAFFMITDPKTTPDARSARILFACTVAALGHWLQFVEQSRPALYFALLATSLAVPLLDRMIPADRFVWRKPVEAVS